MRTYPAADRYGLPGQRMHNLLFGLALACLYLAGTLPSREGMVSAETGQLAEKAGVKRLEGRWIRPDGGIF